MAIVTPSSVVTTALSGGLARLLLSSCAWETPKTANTRNNDKICVSISFKLGFMTCRFFLLKPFKIKYQIARFAFYIKRHPQHQLLGICIGEVKAITGGCIARLVARIDFFELELGLAAGLTGIVNRPD